MVKIGRSCFVNFEVVLLYVDEMSLVSMPNFDTIIFAAVVVVKRSERSTDPSSNPAKAYSCFL